ncbi:hypothetical protein [Amycolatopsis methanolica]|uniref:Uncharacterized protein n=1 Tax=Amycolatopsis methanolica 239 TaxID=1068978 RepID=A0A076MYQ9_AMYME|nr:hypothetical protein [Amycolatopsis methanolica]AIJ26339.1 hypothetical protein AMETH_6247 [Amycolatopsis methanolica 239]AIJ26398.1 hypothetical protein AMETH_6306 [Amycolatopsis methanolica 239]
MTSLYGPVTDADRRAMQRRHLAALNELVKLGMTRKLPPLDWHVPHSFSPLVGIVGAVAPEHHPRNVFGAWLDALSRHPRAKAKPLGFLGTGATLSDRTTASGETELLAAFDVRAAKDAPRVEVVLRASWYEAELDPDTRALSKPARRT